MGQSVSSDRFSQQSESTLAMTVMEESSSEDELFSVDNDTEDESREKLLSRDVSRPEDRMKFAPVNDSNVEEKWWVMALQVFFPFLVAGFGMVAAGLVLDVVQHWDVFVQVSEIFILVPALLGLKGNLEMTLASRLSTASNLGKIDTKEDALSLIVGNLSLIQTQGIVVGFLASITGMILGWGPAGKLNLDHGLLLCASSVLTASIASFTLGLVMVLVIVVSRKLKINPDNVATPIAASLGDLITLSLLGFIASMLWSDLDKEKWLSPIIISVYLLFLPVCIWLTRRCPDTKPILTSGWSPVIIAMLVSSGGGLILQSAVNKFQGIAVFQPVMNGVGGNLVAVLASKISTFLHFQSNGKGPGQLLEGDRICVNPCVLTICGHDAHTKAMCVLLSLVIPGHVMFAYTISYLEAGHTTPTPIFLSIYLLAALIQVSILLYVCRVMVYCMWSRGTDPDNSAIPYLTALGDLLGGAFLGLAFQCLEWIGADEFSNQQESTLKEGLRNSTFLNNSN